MVKQHPTMTARFEFTASGTPQQNGKIERMFATLYGKTRSMLNSARFTTELRRGLWAQCADHAVQLQNILVKTHGDSSACEKFYDYTPKWVHNLRTFGEMAVVADHANKKIRGKLADRGLPCIFVGYAEDHAQNVYKFMNTKTRCILMSRDVIWLNKNFSEYYGIHRVRLEAPPDPVINYGQDHDDTDSDPGYDDFDTNEVQPTEEIDPEEIEDLGDLIHDPPPQEAPEAIVHVPMDVVPEVRTPRVRSSLLEMLRAASFHDPRPSRRHTRSMKKLMVTEKAFSTMVVEQ